MRHCGVSLSFGSWRINRAPVSTFLFQVLFQPHSSGTYFQFTFLLCSLLWLSCVNVLENRVFALFFKSETQSYLLFVWDVFDFNFYIHKRQQETVWALVSVSKTQSWSSLCFLYSPLFYFQWFKERNRNSLWTHNRHCCLLLHRRILRSWKSLPSSLGWKKNMFLVIEAGLKSSSFWES